MLKRLCFPRMGANPRQTVPFPKPYHFFQGIIWLSVLGCGGCTLLPQSSDSIRVQGALSLSGSTTVTPLAIEMGQRYQLDHPKVRITITPSSSSRGIADLQGKRVDIAMVSHQLKDQDQSLFIFPIAQDGLSIALSQQNPVQTLSRQQIQDIYTGKIKNWREVGGKDADIFVISELADHGTSRLFFEYFELDPKQIQEDEETDSPQRILDILLRNSNAIGFLSIGIAEYEIVHGAPIRLLPIEGVEATIANLQNGTFPIRRSLSLVTLTEPTGLPKHFIDYAQSPEVSDLVKEQAFVPLKNER